MTEAIWTTIGAVLAGLIKLLWDWFGKKAANEAEAAAEEKKTDEAQKQQRQDAVKDVQRVNADIKKADQTVKDFLSKP